MFFAMVEIGTTIKSCKENKIGNACVKRQDSLVVLECCVMKGGINVEIFYRT